MISVIIPLYNKESILKRTIYSVLSQNYCDYEIIVVNDGSTDNSAKIVSSIKNSHIRLIEQKNGGPSNARNTGVMNACGKWIVFLDADDELLPNALEMFSNYLELYHDADFIVSPFYNNTGTEKVLKYQYREGYINNAFKDHFYGKFLPRTGAFICKKELLLKYPFNEQIRRFEDLEALFRIYQTARIALTPIPSMIVNTAFADASRGRKNIKEDFLGHLSFKGKSFWEKMCLYQFYIGERTLYPGQVEQNYPMLKYRYDLLILLKIFKYFYAHS